MHTHTHTVDTHTHTHRPSNLISIEGQKCWKEHIWNTVYRSYKILENEKDSAF